MKLNRTLLAAMLALSATATQASVLLYSQNFENPDLAAFNANTGFGGKDASFSSVNDIYANQPAGFTFAQQWTVETLRVGGSQAWGGAGFQDPQSRAGSYVIGMLSSANDDRLGLSFNIGAYKFFNFGNTNGNVTLVIDELVGGYAALDNFRIVASDTQGDVGQVPEPAALALLGMGMAALGLSRRRRHA